MVNMFLKKSLDRILEKLAAQSYATKIVARFVESDRELIIVARLDTITFYHGQSYDSYDKKGNLIEVARHGIISYSISTQLTRRLLWFLIRWWIVMCWCGLRSWFVNLVIRQLTAEKDK